MARIPLGALTTLNTSTHLDPMFVELYAAQATRGYVSALDYVPEGTRAGIQAGTDATDHTAYLQACIDANYGRRILINAGRWNITALTIEPFPDTIYSTPTTLCGEGWPAGQNGNVGATILLHTGASDAIRIDNSTGVNAAQRILIENLALIGDGTNAAGGSGVNMTRINNALIRDCWISGFRDSGIKGTDCYGSAVSDCMISGNRVWGISMVGAFNLGDLTRCKISGNGRAYSSSPVGNLYLNGAGNQNLGVVLQNVNVELAGTQAYSLFKRSDSSLTNIVVASGVATATTATAHGRATGELIAVVGATVAPALNTRYSPAITVTSSTAFTFSSSAADGTYTEGTLIIAPAGYGAYLDNCYGLVGHLYAEDCMGPALYLGGGMRGWEITGGFWFSSTYGCRMIVDDARQGTIGAMTISGANADLYVTNAVGPAAVNVRSDTSLQGGAVITQAATVFMVDGVYRSAAVPASGTWVAGTRVQNSAPTVGQPKGWYCTVGGTPGTWVSEGNL